MTQRRALALIFAGLLVLTAIGVLGLAALGVSGVGMSLGALIPLALAADAIGRVIEHYGEDADKHRKR